VTDDLAVAKQIAAGLRESGGGLPGVRALGLYLHDRTAAQVSTNVHDHRAVRLGEIVEYVRERRRWPEAELIASAPRAAFQDFPADVPLRGFRPERNILEECPTGGGVERPVTSPSWRRPSASARASTAARPAGHDRARPGKTGRLRRARTPSDTRASAARSGSTRRPPLAERDEPERRSAGPGVRSARRGRCSNRASAQGVRARAFMFLLYIPLGFVTDKMIYSYRRKKKAAR
jgi:hypothetical protein